MAAAKIVALGSTNVAKRRSFVGELQVLADLHVQFRKLSFLFNNKLFAIGGTAVQSICPENQAASEHARFLRRIFSERSNQAIAVRRQATHCWSVTGSRF